MTDYELANAVVSRLYDKKMHVATAESCTGGLLCGAIASISGSSNVLEYGIISYANHIKQEELGVSDKELTLYGAVSEQVAVAMACGVKKKANAEIGVSTTGIAGPTGGSNEKPVGTVHIAVVAFDRVYHKKLELLSECGNDRQKIRVATVNHALKLLLEALSDI